MNAQERSETFRNAQERSETIRKGQGRSNLSCTYLSKNERITVKFMFNHRASFRKREREVESELEVERDRDRNRECHL
jgi:hypothetical protein